jgi:hypothetical protein
MARRSSISQVLLAAAALSLAAAGCASNGDKAADVSASVDRDSIRIGDRIGLTVRASAGKSVEVSFPKFDDYRIGEFEIKATSASSRNGVFGGSVQSRRYSITAYTVGKAKIPQIEVRFRKKGDREWTAGKTAAIDIDVVSVLPSGKQASDIRGIKGPLGYDNPFWGILSLAAALAAFAAALWAFYRRIRRYGPVRLPHETALEELESIRAAYLQGGDVKDYYAGVSDCVRRYVERAFGLKAPEMTTEEFLNSLHDSSALTIAQKDLLKGFLNACDLVKFAKYHPSHAEAQALYETAGAFIRETAAPKETPAEQPGGPS